MGLKNALFLIVISFVLLLSADGRAGAATVTAHVGYTSRSAPRSKTTEGFEIVIWLTPLSNETIEEADRELEKLPHRFQLIQAHKHFDPHLLVIPVGSWVDFPNKDPFFHNVFSLFDGKRFDLGLYESGSTRSIKFDRPGVSFIFCNIHPQMSAVIIAMKTPYYGVSDKSGNLEVRGVPAGRYRIEVWSERALPQTLKGLQREVDISEDSMSLGNVIVKSAGDLMAGHKNKYGTDYDSGASAYPTHNQP